MTKKILVTGGTGFVGSHILDRLVYRRDVSNEQIKIFATRRYHLSRRDKVEHLEELVDWVDCDLTDPVSVNLIISNIKPDEIYHMAAESFVSPSWNHPNRYMQVNYGATLNLLEAIKNYNKNSKILLPGSGEEYGLIHENELPINTNTPLRPVNPYAVTKIAQDLIGYVYFESYGLNVIRVRTFNHEGPRRERYFGISSFCYQIARIEAGLQKPEIEVGEIEDKRNFTHISDIVLAYELAMNKAPSGKLFLIASEDNSNIDTFRGVIERLKIKSFAKEKINIKQVDKFTRPTSVPYLIADATEFRNLTGWKSNYNLDQILEDVLNYWRARITLHPNL